MKQTLGPLNRRIENLQHMIAPEDKQAKLALADAKRFSAKASEHENRCEPQEGWIAVHSAQECLMETLDKDQIPIERERILGLADEIRVVARRSWAKVRVGRIRKLLGDEFQAQRHNSIKAKRLRLREALELRNGYWNYLYYEAKLVSKRVAILAGMLAMASTVMVIMAWTGTLNFLGGLDITEEGIVSEEGGNNGPLMTAVAVFGFMGGGLSSILVVATALKDVVSDHAREAVWHLARPFLGAAAALIAVAIIAGGFGLTPTNSTTYLAIGAAAGFSETFLESLVGLIVRSKAD